MNPNEPNQSMAPANHRQHNRAKEPLRFPVFSASLRVDSLNTRVAHLAAHTMKKHGRAIDWAEMKKFDAHSYNQDTESKNGFPRAATQFRRRLLANDAFVISSPEYSASLPGGNHSLWSLRIPLEHLGARGFPNMFSLAIAHQALNADGGLANRRLEQRFESNVSTFMDLAEAAKNYSCMKKAWVKFLGEQPNPVTERVE